MKKNLFILFFIMIFCAPVLIGIAQKTGSENEFVVVKVKNKKESAASVKEDIGQQLELSLRQMSKNIAEQAHVQRQIFDKIKDLIGACEESASGKSVFDGSTVQLKEQRHKLKIFHEKLLQHEQDLQSFLSCF